MQDEIIERLAELSAQIARHEAHICGLASKVTELTDRIEWMRQADSIRFQHVAEHDAIEAAGK